MRKIHIFTLSLLCLFQFNCDYEVVPDLSSDLCDTIVCENNGVCSGGKCVCPPGFGGDNCEVDQACLGVNCNCGDCYKGVCNCPEGITGDNCDTIEVPCNQDCNAGPYGGEWDEETCSCINEIEPVSGCTDTTACNYNPDACVDDGTCSMPPCTLGCTDPCAPNFNSKADENDGSCESYDTTCNQDCTMGDLGFWDAGNCFCVVIVETVLGCTNEDAENYMPNANCDDESCTYDPCNNISCLNGGTCINDGKCECLTTFAGELCEIYTPDLFRGSWSISEICDNPFIEDLWESETTISISVSSLGSTLIVIEQFGILSVLRSDVLKNYGFSINGYQIFIETTEIWENVSLEASGTILNDGNRINLAYTWWDEDGNTNSCASVWTKK